MNIITNNHERELLSYTDLTEAQREQFDYALPLEEGDEYNPRFFSYRGSLYDVQEFTRIYPAHEVRPGFSISAEVGSPLLQWDGAQSDTYFSGVVVRHVIDEFGYTDGDAVVVGSWSA